MEEEYEEDTKRSIEVDYDDLAAECLIDVAEIFDEIGFETELNNGDFSVDIDIEKMLVNRMVHEFKKVFNKEVDEVHVTGTFTLSQAAIDKIMGEEEVECVVRASAGKSMFGTAKWSYDFDYKGSSYTVEHEYLDNDQITLERYDHEEE